MNRLIQKVLKRENTIRIYNMNRYQHGSVFRYFNTSTTKVKSTSDDKKNKIMDIVGFLMLSLLGGGFLISEVIDLPPPEPKTKTKSQTKE